MKKKILALFAFALSFGLISCEFTFNGNSGELGLQLTELPTPEIDNNSFDSSTNTVSWSSVDNCSGYTIKVDSKEYNINALSYKVSFSESKDFTFAVKARGKALYTSDSLWSETFTWHYKKKTSDSKTDKLEVPKNIDCVDNRITWDAVDKATAYRIEIVENDNNPVYFESSINHYDVKFDSNTNFKYRVMSLADDENKNSNWSVQLTGKYISELSYSYYNKEFSNKGLAKSVNLLSENGSYTSIENGAKDIFKDSELSKLETRINAIKSGIQKEITQNSFESYANEYSQVIDKKFNLSKVKPGLKKVVSQKSFDLNINYSNSYEKKTKEETTINIKKVSSLYEYEEYSFRGFSDINKFKKCLSQDFINEAKALQNNITDEGLKTFIKSYGTHFLTSAIYGAKLDMSYTMIGTKEEVAERAKNEALVNLFMSKSFIEGGASVDLEFDKNVLSSNKNLNINASISFYGGNNNATSFNENNMSSFNEFYKEWAKSTNDINNMALVDVADGSLHCVWDLLDDSEFSVLKKRLNNYFDEKANENYKKYLSKFEEMFSKGKNELIVYKGNMKTGESKVNGSGHSISLLFSLDYSIQELKSKGYTKLKFKIDSQLREQDNCEIYFSVFDEQNNNLHKNTFTPNGNLISREYDTYSSEFIVDLNSLSTKKFIVEFKAENKLFKDFYVGNVDCVVKAS